MRDSIKTLEKTLQPSSVAVIGASNDKKKWGNIIVKRLLDGGFAGKIYPINPKGGQILGLPIYNSVYEIKAPVDLAVICVQSNYVYEAVKECLKIGVKGFVINTSGFGETGNKGKEIEGEIVELVRKNGAGIIGPNCMGIYSAKSQLNTNIVPNMVAGSIAVLAQSGNIFVMLYEEALKCNLGFSAYIGVGNQADLHFYEYINYFAEDPDTKAIVIYMEDIKKGREFIEAAQKAVAKKPVIVIKAGYSLSGSKAAASHTGALAGSDTIYDAAFKQAGVIRLHRTDEIFPVVEALLKCPLPKSNRVAILTDGGGFSVLAADGADVFGLKLAQLSEETKGKLRKILPPFANVENNPLDNATDYPFIIAKCTEIIIADENVDAMIFYGVLGGYNTLFSEDYQEEEIDTALKLVEISRKNNKPILITSPYATPQNHCLKVLYEENIPVYSTLELALRSLSALMNYGQNRVNNFSNMDKPGLEVGRDSSVRIITKALVENRLSLLETEARSILESYDIAVPPSKLAHSAYEAVKISSELGFPVVMKIVSKDVIHKSDAGGVKLNLCNEEEVSAGYTEITKSIKLKYPEAEIGGVLITPYYAGGTEVIIGLQNDSRFGPVVMFGLGGIFVEVLKDVAFRVIPIDKEEVIEMIKETKGYKILSGVRGEKVKDINALADIIIKIARVGQENPEINSIDLNPLKSMENGAVILDVRMILSGT